MSRHKLNHINNDYVYQNLCQTEMYWDKVDYFSIIFIDFLRNIEIYKVVKHMRNIQRGNYEIYKRKKKDDR